METRAHHILIGVFTLLVVTAAVLFSLWLAKAGNENKTKHYTVAFTEAVRGLSRGSAVQYNGIRIGEVTKLELDPTDIRRVLVSITILDTIPVKDDTKARLAITGITGTAVIELTGGSPNSPTLTSTNEDIPPVIVATPSSLAELMSGGEELMTHVSELIINANAFLSPENSSSISASITQLETLLARLADSSEGLPKLFVSLEQASSEAAQMMKEAKQLLIKDGATTFAKANEVMQNLVNTTKEFEKILTTNAPAINQGSQGFAQIAPALQELRQTLSNIQAISQELQSNPSGYLFGGDHIQEFQP